MRVFCLSLLLFFCFASYAHEGLIKGTVFIKKNNEPVQGASVLLLEKNLRTTTDIFGAFEFKKLEQGNYKVVITVMGFRPDTVAVIARSHEVDELKIFLTENTVQLSEVVVTHRQEENVQTINKMDIAMRPTRSAQDILRLIPGVVIAQHAGGGKAEQIFLRGFDLDHGTDIALSVDGIPVNMVSHAHGQGYADLHFLIPELVQKVEFNKGPYYAKYGDLCTSGYADFVTSPTVENMVKLEASQFNTFRAMGMFSLLDKQRGERKSNAFIASEYNYSDGYFESPQHFKRFNIFGKYRTVFNNRSILTLSASAFASNWDASGQIPERAVEQGLITRFGAIDDNEGGKTSRINVNAQLTNKFPNDAELTNQVYYSRYGFELYSNFTFFLNDPVNGDQIRQKEMRDVLGYKINYRKHFHSGNSVFTTDIGGAIRYDNVNDIELSHTKDRSITLEQKALGDIRETNIGVYASETWELNSRFTANAALRFDQFFFDYKDKLPAAIPYDRVSASTFSPKLNLSYKISDKVQVHAKTGVGFHSNDTRVVVPQRGIDILPKAFGTDIGFRIKPASHIIIDITGWYLKMQQEFVYVGDEAIVEPSGRTQRLGLDAGLRWQLLKWLYVDADINLTHPRAMDEAKGEDYVPLAPTITSLGGLTASFAENWRASLRYRYVGDRPANEDNSVTAKGYFLMDALVKYQRRKWEYTFSVENLFNAKWNEAQFDTESRLYNEPQPVSELHFTPGNPFWARISVAFKW